MLLVCHVGTGLAARSAALGPGPRPPGFYCANEWKCSEWSLSNRP